MSTTFAKSNIDAMYHEFGRPDVQIGDGEEESPYVPFVPNVYIRHLAFDVRNNYYVNVLWVKGGGMLGRHAGGKLAVSGVRLGGEGRKLCAGESGRNAHAYFG